MREAESGWTHPSPANFLISFRHGWLHRMPTGPKILLPPGRWAAGVVVPFLVLTLKHAHELGDALAARDVR
jgi:hypothetical protein